MGIETIAIIAGAAIAAGTAGYQVSASRDAAREQKQQQRHLQAEAKDTEKKNQLAQAAVAARQRALVASESKAPGLADTSNPLGEIGQANVRQKYLLGE